MSHHIEKLFLNEVHSAMNASFGVFSNFRVPMQYSSSIKEQRHTRESSSVFDISHMFKILIKGENIIDLLNKIIPSTITYYDKCKYTFFLNENGGIIDDIIICPIDKNLAIIVTNPANSKKCIDFLSASEIQNSVNFSLLESTCMFAIQGPESFKALSTIIDNLPISAMQIAAAKFLNEKIIISKTGYTGEKSQFEVMVPHSVSEAFFDKLIKASPINPAGFVARNNLRLEAGFPLHGADIDESINPIEANLGWVIDKNKNNYPGKDVIDNFIKSDADYQMRIKIKVLSNSIPRPQSNILTNNGATVGKITSSGYSTILEGPICQGYILKSKIQNTDLHVIRNENKIYLNPSKEKIIVDRESV